MTDRVPQEWATEFPRSGLGDPLRECPTPRTFNVGHRQKLISVTKEALNIGISKAKVGNTLGDISSAIQKNVEDNGLNVIRDLVGHGIGRELHEPPQVLNYGKEGTGPELVEGMVIAIEPMVVTGGWKIKNGKDGFGFVTKDGGFAAHFEHTIAITKNRPMILTEIKTGGVD